MNSNLKGQIFTVKEVISAVDGNILMGDSSIKIYGVSTDTRKINSGDLFIALKGENFDGNSFLEEADRKGASALVTSLDSPLSREFNGAVIQVRDCLKAYGDLARFYRLRFELPVVCITGSNGKTSTKEMLFSILNQKNKVLKTEGNLNNLIGLPMQLLNLKSEHEKAVFEIGMNRPGEIGRLSEIAVPHLGVITNIARAHLERLHTVASVRDAKGEMIDRISEDGFMIFYGDDAHSTFYTEKSKNRGLQVLTFGSSKRNNIFFKDVVFPYKNGTKFNIFMNGEKKSVWTPQFGYHNVLNAVAAATAASCLGSSLEEIIEGLRKAKSLPMRMTVKAIPNAKGSFLIDDSYNANPDSMLSSFKTAMILKGQAKLFVFFGDMNELGESEFELHSSLIRDLQRISIDSQCVFIFVGIIMSAAVEEIKSYSNLEDNVQSFEFFEEALSWFYENFSNGDWVLVKGSRLSRMERFSEEILN